MQLTNVGVAKSSFLAWLKVKLWARGFRGAEADLLASNSYTFVFFLRNNS